MAAILPSTAGDGALVHLRLAQPAALDPDVVCRALRDEDLPWLGDLVAEATLRPGQRRFQADLGLSGGDAGARPVLRKGAFVDLGPVEATADGCRVAISWRSSSLAPLFPVFAGHLSVTPGALVLEGDYAPPGGDLGAILDRALLNIAARRTALWLLRAFADACVSRSMVAVRDGEAPATLRPCVGLP